MLEAENTNGSNKRSSAPQYWWQHSSPCLVKQQRQHHQHGRVDWREFAAHGIVDPRCVLHKPTREHPGQEVCILDAIIVNYVVLSRIAELKCLP